MEKFRKLSIINSNKLRIKGIIYLLPGIHLRQLQRILGISFHSTRYNVQSLSESGEILRRQEGRYSRLYPSLTHENELALYSVMRNKTTRTILKTLAYEEALSNKQLTEKTGLAKSTISEHIQSLLDERIVRVSLSSEGRVTYELRERDRVLRLAKEAERTMMLLAADRFVELWDF